MAKLEKIYRRLPELKDLEDNIAKLKGNAKIETLTEIPYKGFDFPVHAITIGNENPEAPTLLIVGGVHGLERIGTQVINSVLSSTARALSWDDHFIEQSKNYRTIFVPLLNPVGMYRLSRSNANNVDLMRNAPVESDEPKQPFYGGHRISPRLPFYRGAGSEMEKENQVLWELVQKQVLPAKVSIALDIHSGFGSRDRIWFPYARTRKPFPHLAEMHALKSLFDETYEHHVYTVEPQAQQYTTHGDVWDYFYDEHLKSGGRGLFLPITLEMGSWLWIRKNPLQALNPLGIFNPITPHRVRRMLRRHKALVDFLRRAVLSPRSWALLAEKDRENHLQQALSLWYRKTV